jgi:hypothetical protein
MSERLDVIVAQLAENSVDTLDLTGSKGSILSKGDLSAIAPLLKSNTSLKHLSVSLNGLDDEGFQILAGALAGNVHCNIESLHVSANHATDLGASSLLAALPPSVTELDLSGNSLTSVLVATLVGKLTDGSNQLSLKTLQLRDAGLGDGVWGTLLAPSSWTSYLGSSDCQLTSLHMSGNDFTDRSTPCIAQVVQRNETLTTFNISNTAIKDYFPIAEALVKNDTLLLFPLASNGARLKFSSVEPKLKENERRRAAAKESLHLKKLQDDHKMEMRKVQRKHDAEVADLKAAIVALQRQLQVATSSHS